MIYKSNLFPFSSDAVDYSKCLTKGELQDCEKTIGDDDDKHILTYNDFTKIVGPAKIKKFEGINEITDENDDQDFWNVFRVWQHFENPVQEDQSSVEKLRILQA